VPTLTMMLSGLILSWGVLVTATAAQETTDRDDPPAALVGHKEMQGDSPAPRAELPPPDMTEPARSVISGTHQSIQVNVTYVNGEPHNIVGDAANEPSIAVDPTNPDRIVIGWRQFDTVASNFRQAGYGYSLDHGRSWVFPGVIEPGVFRSDPVLDADADGNVYYYSLTTGWRCHLFQAITVDGGVSWLGGVDAHGGDKAWMAIDRTDGLGRGNIYMNWSRSVSSCDGQFTLSYDGGQTFLPCTDVPGNPQWGTMAVGPDGELYVVGLGFIVAKSSTVQDETLPVAWDFTTSVDLGGSIVFGGGPNPGGLLGQAWIAVDHSDGPTRGNVYLLCSVVRGPIEDPDDPLDVMFARSTDGGQTWSEPIRVNADPGGNGAWQWFGTMSVSPNGRIDVIWYDTRQDPGGYDSRLYYSHSTDAGHTWSANMALSPAFDPHLGWPSQNKLGDYCDMVSDEWGAYLAYAATFNGEQDVYYLRVGDDDCNGNGIADSIDISDGTSHDCNSDGIPDECQPDTCPPTPHPMTWETEPEPVSTTEITMTATEATDTGSPPVEYYFRCESGGCTTSGWIADRAYSDTDLLANTEYAHKVRAQDSAEPPNRGAWSDPASTFTRIETPSGISFGTVGETAIEVTADGMFTNLDMGDSGLFFDWELTGTGAPVGNSGWQQMTTIIASDLMCGTAYTFRVRARNQDGVETATIEADHRTETGAGCACPGDLNTDTVADGADIALFVGMFTESVPVDSCADFAAPFGGPLDEADLQGFVARLLDGFTCP